MATVSSHVALVVGVMRLNNPAGETLATAYALPSKVCSNFSDNAAAMSRISISSVDAVSCISHCLLISIVAYNQSGANVLSVNVPD
jgi:hypothetical protein